jgi:CrcB protein
VTLLGVALAGALGGVARYVLDGFVQERVGGVFPWGTWLVNVSGAFALGFLAGLTLYHGLTDTPRVVVGTGFLGAYTTFSTFMYETARLYEDGARYESALNVVASVAAGLGAAALGLGLAALL